MSALAIAIILTWVFNHTRGSLLMAMLVHAAINAFQSYANELFPAQADSLAGPTLGFAILALLIVLLTRGRLGYEAYRKGSDCSPREHRYLNDCEEFSSTCRPRG